MSTSALIGLKPIARSRFCIHSGEGPLVTPRTSRKAKAGQRCLSAGPKSSCTRGGQSNAPACGLGACVFSLPSRAAARSRAIPATPVASGRFGVTATSMTGSSSPAYCAYATPTGASSGNSITPSWSSLSSSSAAEQSMPFDSTPRMTPLARVSFLPGIYVPTGENTLFMPVRALGAPQTTCTGPPPASTMQTFSRSALGCCLASITEATTKPSYFRAGSSTDSTSRPTRVSVSTISLSEAEVSRWAFSQERVNFIAIQQRGVRIRSPAQSPGERRDVERLEAVVVDPTQIRIEEVAQIRQAVFEHRKSVEPDAPGEALIDLRVEAAIGQHVGIDHAAAEAFEPILGLAEANLSARTSALDVDL